MQLRREESFEGSPVSNTICISKPLNAINEIYVWSDQPQGFVVPWKSL